MTDCVDNLVNLGIEPLDAEDLRRIAMQLHHWHERECGYDNGYASVCITRGYKKSGEFTYDDDGDAYDEIHPHSSNKATYTRTRDMERGALKRLDQIMSRYPDLASYVQGDPRGASLYIIKRGTYPEGQLDSYYSRGVAVYK